MPRTQTMHDTAEKLRAQYALRFSGNTEYRSRVWAVLVSHFSRWIPADATVLDVGCGWGEFINAVRARERFGMDLNPESGQRLAPGVRFLQQDCSAEWQVPAASLDVVFSSNFFEHLPDKGSLQRTLMQAHRALRPGGRLICMGPNIRYLPGAYWDFWDHYLPLTHLSMSEGLRLAGFEIERCVARFLPYSMSQGRQPPVALLRLYLRMPLAWRFLGRQFFIVARKPAGRPPGA